jgi:CHAD domain-containing protein
MSSRHKETLFRLTDRFDVAHLVSALKRAGWAVRRGRGAQLAGAVLDTADGEILGAGLVALEERQGRRLALEIWLVPKRGQHSARLVASSRGGSPGLRAIFAEDLQMRLGASRSPIATFRKDVVSFNVSSNAARAMIRIETVHPDRKGARPIACLRLCGSTGGARAIGPLADLIRRQDGVSDEIAPGPADLLSAFGITPGPRLAPPVECAIGESAGGAAVAILKRHFANMLAEEPGARLGLDPEYVHDMRVALRRMRAALRMFRKAFLKSERARLNAELRWLAKLLGAVRDLDVYIDAVPRYLSYIDGDAADYAFFLNELKRRRRAARAELLAGLDSRRYADFKARAERFLSAPPISDVEMPLETVAEAGLGAFAREVFRKGAKIRTEEDLHALRISFKRLRYAVEFLGGLSPKRMAKLARIASRYQDILGAFNDATVACARVREAVKNDDRDRFDILLLGYLFACQRLAAIGAKNEFFRRWSGRGAKRLAQALKAALARL